MNSPARLAQDDGKASGTEVCAVLEVGGCQHSREPSPLPGADWKVGLGNMA